MSIRFLLRIIFSALIVLIAINGKAQDSLTIKKKYKKLYFYTWGFPKFYEDSWDQDCELELQKEYGFGEIVKAGCVVMDGQVKKWERHNNRIDKRMRKRHGDNWRDKFEAELKKCLK